jgi:polyisoprenoid-binding protein YceI
MRSTKLVVAMLAIGAMVGSLSLDAQQRTIDVDKSSLTIRVFKSGVFSGFAHDHEIQAPIAEGRIEEGKADSSTKPSVQFRVDARQMRVLDPDVAADKRAAIQKTMQSPAVLDVEKFPKISFQSTTVTKKGEAGWEVRGTLTLCGKQEPVVVAVISETGHYRGSASIKQSDFGIEPSRIAGGTVKVKDEIKIEFDIVESK